ncbi:hypothetical protein AOE01nite_36370 [Acetobacter oeni]|uniref:Uncharacterized protein n=1 Tax=Acetobacter oeni TaxID=304077 RepID=A0A511XR31_9PROT|nr:hypothetical protein AA21952_1965 [Acetobacter oeni LMG 21952]GEN65413.1 hypothetical protein AOE01nite_36370 [Acetobacter oeni]
MDRLFGRIEDKARMGCPADTPVDDRRGEDINDERDADEPRPGCDLALSDPFVQPMC